MGKYIFGHNFCEHNIDTDGISCLPDKTKATQDIPTPTSIRQPKHFISLIHFYRRFVPNYSLTLLLTNLIQKNNKSIIFKQNALEIFSVTNSTLVKFMKLSYIDNSLEMKILLTTDASDTSHRCSHQTRIKFPT